MSYQTGNCEAEKDKPVPQKNHKQKKGKYKVELRWKPESIFGDRNGEIWSKPATYRTLEQAEYEAEKWERKYRFVSATVVPNV